MRQGKVLACEPILSLKEQLEITKQKIKELEKEFKALAAVRKFAIARISHDSELVRHFTGFQSLDLFDNFYLWLEPYAKNMVTWFNLSVLKAMPVQT